MISQQYLDNIMKMNNTYGHNTYNESIIDSMVDSYNRSIDNVITDFDIRIKTKDAFDIFINNSDTSVKALIDISKKETVGSDSEEIVRVHPRVIKAGDYFKVKYKNSDEYVNYLIRSDIKHDRTHDYAMISKCERTLNWSGLEVLQPCYVTSDSFGSKIVTDNELLSSIDTKARVYVQANEYTKIIVPDFRLIFCNDKHGIYKVSDKEVFKDGIYMLTCKKDKYMQGDDLENNIAYNDGLIPKKVEKYELLGDTFINIGEKVMFKMNDGNNFKFVSSDSSIATIRGYSNGCEVEALKPNEIFEIIVKDSTYKEICRKIVRTKVVSIWD